MARPVFADPKTDFAFHRIFGSERHKVALLGFLNDILSLDGEHRIVDVTFLDPVQRPKVEELKHSVVDVKCRDARGIHCATANENRRGRLPALLSNPELKPRPGPVD